MSEHDRLLDEAADSIFVAAHMLKAMADSYQLTLLKKHRASNLVDWRRAECDAMDDLAARLLAIWDRGPVVPDDWREIHTVAAHLYMIAASLGGDGGVWRGRGIALGLLADRLDIDASNLRSLPGTAKAA